VCWGLSKGYIVYFVNRYGWPDGAATARMLCQALRAAPSHVSITLVQGAPSYAVYQQETRISRVKIVKVWTPLLPWRFMWGRLIDCFVFYVQVALILLFRKEGGDVVVMTTPPFLIWIGAASKMIRGGRLISWEMDVYPEILFATKMVRKNGLVGRLLEEITRWARRRADVIIALGPCMVRKLAENGWTRGVAEVHNWADGVRLFPVTIPGSSETLRILYSGNLGVAHDIETLVAATKQLAGEPVRFVFSGRSAKIASIAAANFSNVDVVAPCGEEELNFALNGADVGLVTQTVESLGCVVPSKLYGLLAAGRPVLYVGPRESTVWQVVLENQCGWVVEVGDIKALVLVIRSLLDNRDEVRRAGLRARVAFEAKFSEVIGVGKFWSALVGRRELT
jgi:colanic acid biosynthesis glycosyl transferase WcaI